MLNQEKFAISREQGSTQTPRPLGVLVQVCPPRPAELRAPERGPQAPRGQCRDSPMQISSSVSASPMQRNLNSLRESANLRLAADRSAREGKTHVRAGKSPQTSQCGQRREPSQSRGETRRWDPRPQPAEGRTSMGASAEVYCSPSCRFSPRSPSY